MNNDLFEKSPVSKAYFKLALPVVFSMVVSLIYNMVDTYFIAQTKNTDLIAGVALCAPIFTLMIAIGDIFGLGGSSVISRLFGQKKDSDGKRLSAFCFYSALIIGLIITLIMTTFRTPILRMLGADMYTLPYAKDYYTYLVLGAPAIILTFTPSNLLRTEGFATASMLGTILGSIINMILDPLFIFTLNMGAKGAAIATVIGNVCIDLFFLWFLINKSKRLSVNPKLVRVTKFDLKEIFSIGIPASITNLMQSFGIALTNIFLLTYGNDKIAAMGIVMKVNMIAVLILVGFSFGAQPLIGYNYGAKNYTRIKSILKFAFLFEGTLALILTLVLSIPAKGILSCITDDTQLITIGVSMLRYQLICMVFISIILICISTFQSSGKAWSAFLLSISRQGIIFAIVIFIVSHAFGYTGILASQAIADILTSILAIILLRRVFLSLPR